MTPAPASVLSDGTILELIEQGRIKVQPWDPKMVQPASIDLRLGAVAYQLRASFLPFRETVANRLDGDADLVIDRLALTDGATLQRGSVYLVPLLESLALIWKTTRISNSVSALVRNSAPKCSMHSITHGSPCRI